MEFQKLKKKIYIEEAEFMQKIKLIQIDYKILRIAR